MRMAVDLVKVVAIGKVRTSARLVTERVVHLVKAMATQVTPTPMGLVMRMELVVGAAPVEATGMVADLVVARESGKVKAKTMVPMARALQIAVAPEAGAEAVVMVGSAAVPVADQGGVVVPHQVIMMAATTDHHLKVHLLEIIWSWDDSYVRSI
jgi:hypothetical protein